PVLQGLLRKNPGRRISAEQAERLLRRAAAEPSLAIAASASRTLLPLRSRVPQALDAPEPVASAERAARARAYGASRLLAAVLVAAALLAGALATGGLPLASFGSGKARAAARAMNVYTRTPATTDPTTAPTSNPATAPTRSPAGFRPRTPTSSAAATGTATS